MNSYICYKRRRTKLRFWSGKKTCIGKIGETTDLPLAMHFWECQQRMETDLLCHDGPTRYSRDVDKACFKEKLKYETEPWFHGQCQIVWACDISEVHGPSLSSSCLVQLYKLQDITFLVDPSINHSFSILHAMQGQNHVVRPRMRLRPSYKKIYCCSLPLITTQHFLFVMVTHETGGNLKCFKNTWELETSGEKQPLIGEPNNQEHSGSLYITWQTCILVALGIMISLRRGQGCWTSLRRLTSSRGATQLFGALRAIAQPLSPIVALGQPLSPSRALGQQSHAFPLRDCSWPSKQYYDSSHGSGFVPLNTIGYDFSFLQVLTMNVIFCKQCIQYRNLENIDDLHKGQR